jgi:hypothetical protein
MPRQTFVFLAAGLSLLLGAGGAPASAAFTYTTIDHPLAGPGGTIPNDVEDNVIAGTYLDAANVSHGFIYDGTTWTTLDAPAAAAPRGTEGYGYSNGIVVGSFVAATGQTFGYLYDGTSWTTLEHPSIGTGPVDTFPRGTWNGTVVGFAIESLVGRGFVYRDGNFTDVLIPGSLGTFPRDIYGSRIAGNFDDATGSHGFVLDGATLQVIDDPLGPSLGTFVKGVDGVNLVGNYLSLIDGQSHGFLFDGANFIAIDVPGATDTAATGIHGTRIIGMYVDAAGATHGFVTTVPDPAGATAFLLAIGPVICRRRRR